MRKGIRYAATTILGMALLIGSVVPGSADPSLEETKKLLQKSLTLYEIDQEITRLTESEKRIAQDIEKNEDQIKTKEVEVTLTREHAGKVLRAYYMGERDHIWMLLFTANSFSDALTVYEYLSMIVQNDQRTLSAYADTYKGLKEARQKLLDTRTALAQIKEQFLLQREKVVALQTEIDKQLEESPDGIALAAELNRFTVEWKEKGVPLFRKYLSAISGSMQSLPELITGENGSKYVKGLSLTQKSMEFEISDQDLNAFFRSKNDIFRNMSFRFEDGQFKASGMEEGTEVSITGEYTVENDPQNRLQFRVHELTYNGFVLPESSNRALEEEFNLGFIPDKVVKGLQVREVTLKDGKLNLKLKL